MDGITVCKLILNKKKRKNIMANVKKRKSNIIRKIRNKKVNMEEVTIKIFPKKKKKYKKVCNESL